MPELPEVETVCRGLRQSVVGRVITEMELRRAAIRIPIPRELPERARGARITGVERRAKYILIYMDNGMVMIVHLGMSGRMMVLSALPAVMDRHDHVLWHLDDNRLIIFNDPRRFGLVTYCSAQELATHPLLAGLGVEPFSDAFSADYLQEAALRRKQPVKPFLMDQRVVVGVGNIYASEALFLVGISPERPANKLLKKHFHALVPAIRETLQAAIDSGGSTLRNYVDSRGESGYFQHRFAVYDKEGEPCPGCAAPVIRSVQAGRATYFCKKCQK